MISSKLLSKIIDKWPVKVLSAAAALIIFIFYRMSTLETHAFTVPLVIEPNESLVPASYVTDSVKVTLRGESNGIMSILEEDIEAYIDLGKFINEGSYRIPVQIRKKGSSLGVAPLEITTLPIEIPLLLEQKLIRNIPVFPVFSGSVADGYELAGQTIIPENIVAEGPRGALEGFFEFNTETIDLEGRYDNFSVRVSVINNNPLVKIHGSRMIECRGRINRITRSPQNEAAANETLAGEQ